MFGTKLNRYLGLKSENKDRKLLGLIARCKDEYFIREFCEYYLAEGVDRIYIIDDNSEDKSIYSGIDTDSVEIIYEKDIIRSDYAQTLYDRIRNDFVWMIYVDVDEFITTRRNPGNSIRQEILTTFKDVDCIKIPWVMMAAKDQDTSPVSVLKGNVYRWDHDRRHPHPVQKFRCRYDQIEVKCIFRTAAFKSIWDHHPKRPVSRRPKVVDGIRAEDAELNPFHQNLRERDIAEGYLLCYHYRIISVENSRQKLKSNLWYIENGYSLEDLMTSDHPEKLDMTLSGKSSFVSA